MKKFMLTFIVLPILASFSCSGEDAVTDLMGNCSNNNKVTIQLRTGLDITEHSSSFDKTNANAISTRTSTTTSANTFTPTLPKTFNAYFVAAEDKGQYQTGKMVKAVKVSNGDNAITLPAMRYKIYVTNYDLDKIRDNSKPETSLPESSSTLYYFGSSEKDLESDGITLDVTLSNPYATVAICKNSCVSSSPVYKDNNTYCENGNWYYLYIRNSETDTKIPVEIEKNTTTNYTLTKDILPNHIYEYTLSRNVSTVGGSLNITVNGFTNTYSSDINL